MTMDDTQQLSNRENQKQYLNYNDLLPFNKISPRLSNILRSRKIHTYIDLAEFAEGEFWKVRGCAKRYFNEVQCVLEKKGMPLQKKKACKKAKVRDKVITTMIVCGESSTDVGIMHGITPQRAMYLFHKTAKIYGKKGLNELRENPDEILRLLFDFPPE